MQGKLDYAEACSLLLCNAWELAQKSVHGFSQSNCNFFGVYLEPIISCIEFTVLKYKCPERW